MICVNNDSRCIQIGYCSCHQEDMNEATSGCGEILIFLVAGVFLSFIYPSLKIMRSNAKFEGDGSPKFSGAVWLFTSPLFGLLSTMIFQVTFALGACAAEALQSKVTNSIHVIGIFIIYALAIGLAVISFIFKNRKAVGLVLSEAESRTVNKIIVLVCAGLMALLAVFFAVGAVFTVANAYFESKTTIRQANKNKQKLISIEKDMFGSYVGKYKIATRNDNILFLISKSSGERGLRLNIDGESSAEANNLGCLLTPQIEGNSVYYGVSECVVDEKTSPLEKVYFNILKGRTEMIFIYGIGEGSDTLEKIR